MDYIAVQQVYRHGLIPTSYTDQSPVKDPVLPEWAKRLGLRPFRTREKQNLGPVSFPEACRCAVFSQAAVNRPIWLRNVFRCVDVSGNTQTFLDRCNCILVYMLDQDRTSGFKTIEMDMFVFAEQPG